MHLSYWVQYTESYFLIVFALLNECLVNLEITRDKMRLVKIANSHSSEQKWFLLWFMVGRKRVHIKIIEITSVCEVEWLFHMQIRGMC